jgi:hypothetical protein
LISRFNFSSFWVPLEISTNDVVLSLVLRMLDVDDVDGDDFAMKMMS